MDLMTDAWGNQIEMFKDADEFQIWFYDPGGCMCDTSRYNCKGLQAERLMEQVDTFTQIIWTKNPAATISVSAWPIWALESEYGIRYRESFLDQLKTFFSIDFDRITVADSVDHGDSVLIQAGQRGFRLNGFVFPTNVETGYPFVIPMLDYLKSAVNLGKTRQVDAMYCMRIEEGSKFPNTFFASRYFWDDTLSRDEVARQYARWVANTNPEAAEKLFQAFILLDTFVDDGSAVQDHEAKGAQIRDLVESALTLLSAEKQDELEWLLTTARAMAILGEAVEHKDDAQRMQTLRTQFSSLMYASAAFEDFAPYAGSRFSDFVNWLDQGWASIHF